MCECVCLCAYMRVCLDFLYVVIPLPVITLKICGERNCFSPFSTQVVWGGLHAPSLWYSMCSKTRWNQDITLPGQEWTCDSSHVTKNQSHWNHKAFVKVMKKWRAVHSLMLLLSLRACTAKAATTVRKLVFHSTCLAISVKNFYGCFSPPYFATYSLFRVS